MADASEVGVLFVEGEDDCHAIIHLLARHHIVLDEVTGPVRIDVAGSDAKVLNAIAVAVKASGKHPVGFVVDSDIKLSDRWNAIRSKLDSVGVEIPTNKHNPSGLLPASGFISRSPAFDRRVGAWIMPDNRTDYGKIEDLLSTLVPVGDDLFELAKRATAEAIGISASDKAGRTRIQPKDEPKGQLHAWLSWQQEPGMSYGHALRRKYFGHDSDVARAFVSWFKQLYGIGERGLVTGEAALNS